MRSSVGSLDATAARGRFGGQLSLRLSKHLQRLPAHESTELTGIEFMGIKEDVYYEGGPHRGDLIVNLLLGLTVICLPLTVGAIARSLWLRYRITSRRISITSGWQGRDRSDVIYPEITKVVCVPRGWGAWGDMVLTLKDGSRLEMRAVPNFRAAFDYINERIGSNTAKVASEAKK